MAFIMCSTVLAFEDRQMSSTFMEVGHTGSDMEKRMEGCIINRGGWLRHIKTERAEKREVTKKENQMVPAVKSSWDNIYVIETLPSDS